MSEIDELIEKAKERNAETEQQLRTIEQEQEERLKQERESRERFSKAIGEKFPDKKSKVTVEMEAYLAEKDAQKRLAKKQEFAESLGLTIDELDVYLNQKGDKK